MSKTRYKNRIDCYKCEHHQKMKPYDDGSNVYSDWCKTKKIRLAGTYSFPRECELFIMKSQQLLFEVGE